MGGGMGCGTEGMLIMNGSELLGRLWVLNLVVGLVAVGLGLTALIWPGRTLLVLAVVVGVHLLVSGVGRLITAVADRRLESRWLVAFVGLFGVLGGLLVLRQPDRTIAFVVVVSGLFWVLSGITDLIAAFGDETVDDRLSVAGRGAVTAAGGLVVILWPSVTLLVLAVVAGLNLIAVGLTQILVAVRARRTLRASDALQPAAS